VEESAIQFTKAQLKSLENYFTASATNASDAMSRWLSVNSLITIESFRQLPLEDAAGIMGDSEQPLCFCTMEIMGTLTGMIVLAFNDEDGLSLSDQLLNRRVGTALEWSDIEQSAALESTNIICTAFLNTLSTQFPNQESITMIPSPPVFSRDFAESQLEALFLDQAIDANEIFLVQTSFRLDNESLNWTLLFVPDMQSLAFLRDILPESDES